LGATSEIVAIARSSVGKEAFEGLSAMVADMVEHPGSVGRAINEVVNLGPKAEAHIVGEALQHTVKGAPETAIQAPVVDTTIEFSQLAELRHHGVRTYDPLRTLVRIPGYGASAETAFELEKLIASAKTVAQETGDRHAVEQHIAKSYLTAFRHGGYRPLEAHEQAEHVIPNYAGREYKYAPPMLKHKPYEPTLLRLTKNGVNAFYGNIDGRRRAFAAVIHTDDGLDWILPQDKTLMTSTYNRSDELFAQVNESKAEPHSSASIAKNLERVAEQEWLNAQTWRWRRGSAGISQVEARTWLEMVDIDSTRFKEGVDPNLEALTRDMNDYKSVYPDFFDSYPQYFDTH
jgi:hypothetical protein